MTAKTGNDKSAARKMREQLRRNDDFAFGWRRTGNGKSKMRGFFAALRMTGVIEVRGGEISGFGVPLVSILEFR